jgi:phosphate starvation-inducible PhoH-like protein
LPEANAIAAVVELDLAPADHARMANLCGQFDTHLRQIEQRLAIHIKSRGSRFQLTGSPDGTEAGRRVLEDLYALTETENLDPERVHMSLQEHARLESRTPTSTTSFHTRRRDVRARGTNQVAYARAMREQDLTFGIGPAGTGKTYLAVAASVEALDTDTVRRIVLVRPAVEAGEKLGFLPGDGGVGLIAGALVHQLWNERTMSRNSSVNSSRRSSSAAMRMCSSAKPSR